MKVYTKNYIGKGTQVETKEGKKLEIVKMTLKLEDLIKIAHDYKGEDYVTFEVATLRNEDQFGHTHTVYTTVFEDSPEIKPEEITVKPKAKRRTKKQIAEDLILEVTEE